MRYWHALNMRRIRRLVVDIDNTWIRLDRGFAKLYPQACPWNAPKKRIDITTVKVFVHISCAACHPAVISRSSTVGACNQNL